MSGALETMLSERLLFKIAKDRIELDIKRIPIAPETAEEKAWKNHKRELLTQMRKLASCINEEIALGNTPENVCRYFSQCFKTMKDGLNARNPQEYQNAMHELQRLKNNIPSGISLSTRERMTCIMGGIIAVSTIIAGTCLFPFFAPLAAIAPLIVHSGTYGGGMLAGASLFSAHLRKMHLRTNINQAIEETTAEFSSPSPA